MSRARTASRADVEAAPNTSSTTLSPAVLLSAATAATKDPADAQEELLSVLLESQQLAPAIKAIFDRSWQDSYSLKLATHVARKDVEVKNICHTHYEEFIACIDQLVTVKDDLRSLRERIVSFNNDVAESSQAVLQEATELMEYRLKRRNMRLAMDRNNACIYVLNLLIKANEQIQHKKYFSALKSIDSLQRHHLPRFAHLSFVKHVREQVPKLLNQVRDSVKQEFAAWLQSIRITSREVGSSVMSQQQESLRAEERKKRARAHHVYMQSLTPTGSSQNDHAAAVAAAVSAFREHDDDQSAPTELTFDKVKIDFSPVYQCVHIYESMNEAVQFTQLYKDSRRSMAMLALDIQDHQACLSQLSGFFAVEDAVLRSGIELLPRTEVEQIWELAIGRLKMVLKEQFNKIQDPAQFLELKRFVVLFGKTMEGYALHVAPLFEFLMSIREQFETLLFNRLSAELSEIYSRDTFEPLTIDSFDEYNKFVVAYCLQDPAVAAPSTFPTSVPFSLSCPLICRAVRNLIHDYVAFSDHLPDMELSIRKAVDIALSHYVSNSLFDVLESGPKHISQPCQLSINASHLALSCDFFEAYTSSFGDPRYLKAFRLQAREQLESTRIRCMDYIMELIDNKVDELMSLQSSVAWLAEEQSNEPNEYVMDMVAYLSTTFSCMDHMPEGFRQAIHFTSCKHIADTFVSILATAPITFNIISLHSLSLDVAELEQFARSRDIPDLDSKFAEIRQTLDLFLSGNIEQILDAPTRQTKFAQVNLGRLAKIMNKFVELGFFVRQPPSLPKLKDRSVHNVMQALQSMR